MPEPLGMLAGDCTVTYEDSDETRRERGVGLQSQHSIANGNNRG